ncbi:MAG: glutathione synthase [Proteobacteria bacterium]|nr:glutathione synthase [Pseudomonadota bacterium]MBU1585867.1 glutathione synthase [Pseudomonadota bacterium]MBU2455664.1 glutathione synthase [Pseudomonadota bacterium]MBU2627549.1 glutathione synthase [Pseudomonadota bacterium]
MKIGFLMDDLRHIDPIWETTAYLMYECNQRDHTVYFLEPHDIYIRDNKVVARMRNISVQSGLSMEEYWKALLRCLDQEELIFETVTDLDALFLRKDPPIIYEVMEFLGPVSDKVFMINSTAGQLNGNSKVYILNFPEIIPETHVSRDPRRLKKLIDNFGGDMVIKPLQGHGGHGVIKVSNRDQENLNSLINYYVRAGKPYPERRPIMVQEYLKKVKKDGDIRILLLNGEILGAMARKSVSGDFRTNVHAGAMAFKHVITREQKEICEIIKPKLIKDGLFFVGIDIIGDKLVEVNCVSPGGIPRINLFNNDKLESKVVDFVEQKIIESKKSEGYKTVQLVG